jgi:hypothetical protein
MREGYTMFGVKVKAPENEEKSYMQNIVGLDIFFSSA